MARFTYSIPFQVCSCGNLPGRSLVHRSLQARPLPTFLYADPVRPGKKYTLLEVKLFQFRECSSECSSSLGWASHSPCIRKNGRRFAGLPLPWWLFPTLGAVKRFFVNIWPGKLHDGRYSRLEIKLFGGSAFRLGDQKLLRLRLAWNIFLLRQELGGRVAYSAWFFTVPLLTCFGERNLTFSYLLYRTTWLAAVRRRSMVALALVCAPNDKYTQTPQWVQPRSRLTRECKSPMRVGETTKH